MFNSKVFLFLIASQPSAATTQIDQLFSKMLNSVLDVLTFSIIEGGVQYLCKSVVHVIGVREKLFRQVARSAQNHLNQRKHR